MSFDNFSSLNVFGLAVLGVSCAVIFYYLYFIIEDIARKGSSNYLNWIHAMLEKMFIKVPRSRCAAIVITPS